MIHNLSKKSSKQSRWQSIDEYQILKLIKILYNHISRIKKRVWRTINKALKNSNLNQAKPTAIFSY